MPGKFTEKSKGALGSALLLAREMGHTYIGSEHILLGLLSDPDSASCKLLTARGADLERVKRAVIEVSGTGEYSSVTPQDMTPRAKKIIEASAFESQKNSNAFIGTEHILMALLSERTSVAVKLLESIGVSPADIKNDLSGFIGLSAEKSKSSGESSAEDKPKIKGAPALGTYGKDLTALAKAGKIDPIIGREEETARLIRILSRRSKNNPCLIGEPGVGKTAVVEGLALRIAEGNVPETLRNKQIITLDIPAMIAGAKYRGEFEERMKNVLEEASKFPNLILFIDEFHMIIGAGAAEGAVDAANIIKPALARGEMQLIGATTISEYRNHIEKDAALERRFQAVMINEPTMEEALNILRGLREKYEQHHRLKISDSALSAAVRLSVRYIPDRFLPDKAIDLVDEAASKLRLSARSAKSGSKAIEDTLARLSKKKEEAILSKDFDRALKIKEEETRLKDLLENPDSAIFGEAEEELIVTEADIADIVRGQTGIPVNSLIEEESEKLLRLEDALKASVIGQNRAIEAVSCAIRRARMGLKDPSRPIGSFIFLGQTGVGKTELAKALACVLFGGTGAMIRFDMSEYMEKHSVSKLIGAPAGYVGYGEGGQLTEKVRRRPYSVILFDEIEKAHPDVFNILLQILEDGILTDSQGRRVDFRNTVIIMTSNLGASARALKNTRFRAKHDRERKKSGGGKDALRAGNHFKPEFLNRVDDIIVFNPLGKNEISEIAKIMLTDVVKRAKELEINLKFDDSVPELLANKGYSTTYGARQLRRAVIKMVEDILSSELLEGKIKSGDSITAKTKNDGVSFEKE